MPYFLGPDVIVERKEAGDFLSSIMDGRYDYQAQDLIASGKRCAAYIIEGDIYAEKHTDLPEENRQYAISFLAVHRRAAVLQTRNKEETAALLLKMASHAQRPPVDPSWHRAKPKADLALQQKYLLAALPKVGNTLAERLVARFGSPMAVFTASDEELCEVKGVGPERASHIRRVLGGRTTSR